MFLFGSCSYDNHDMFFGDLILGSCYETGMVIISLLHGEPAMPIQDSDCLGIWGWGDHIMLVRTSSGFLVWIWGWCLDDCDGIDMYRWWWGVRMGVCFVFFCGLGGGDDEWGNWDRNRVGLGTELLQLGGSWPAYGCWTRGPPPLLEKKIMASWLAWGIFQSSHG